MLLSMNLLAKNFEASRGLLSFLPNPFASFDFRLFIFDGSIIRLTLFFRHTILVLSFVFFPLLRVFFQSDFAFLRKPEIFFRTSFFRKPVFQKKPAFFAHFLQKLFGFFDALSFFALKNPKDIGLLRFHAFFALLASLFFPCICPASGRYSSGCAGARLYRPRTQKNRLETKVSRRFCCFRMRMGLRLRGRWSPAQRSGSRAGFACAYPHRYPESEAAPWRLRCRSSGNNSALWSGAA